MKINTSRFGETEIEDEKIIKFSKGILGFESSKRFALIRADETMPLYWLQSMDEDISLPCINPYEFFPDYAPMVDKSGLSEIKAKDVETLLVLTAVVVRENPLDTTANLAAPIVVNIKNNMGAQIVLQNTSYDVRERLFSEKEGAGNAGTVKKAQ